jgi:hypothetical protein
MKTTENLIINVKYKLRNSPRMNKKKEKNEIYQRESTTYGGLMERVNVPGDKIRINGM